MWTIVIALAVGTVVGIALPLIFGYDWGERISGGFMGAMIGFMCGLLLGIFLATTIIGPMNHQVQVVREKQPLVSLQDATGVHGSFAGMFFLAEGHVDSDVRIYYYESTPKGYQLHWMSETDPHVYIVQENRTDGELDVMSYQFRNPQDASWGLPSDTLEYVFHVPNGSITTCYKLTAGINSSCPSS